METKEKVKLVYIAKDGKEFCSERKCKNYEKDLDAIDLKNKILNIDLGNLNKEIINVFNKQNKSYSINIQDAWELVDELNLLEDTESMLYKSYNGKWSIGYLRWEYIEDRITGETAPEVICRFAY